MRFKEGAIGLGEEVRVGRNLARLRLAAGGLRRSGGLILGLALAAAVAVFWPVAFEEMKYALGRTKAGQGWVRLTNVNVELVQEQAPREQKPKEKPGWKAPDENYSIYIPKILAKSRVIPNVDPWDKTEYQWALKLGVAEAAGLSHPGEEGTTYLFAHSVGTRLDFARYNAVFYLLHKLGEGDVVEVVYRGELFKYRVEAKEVLEARDLKYFSNQGGEEKLVLQTCYPPGTVWKRLVVVAKRSS